MTRFFQRSLPFLVALSAACGARSLLPEGRADAGAGGATTTTSTVSTTGTTSTTGTGGAQPVCNPSYPAQVIDFPVPNVLARRPALVGVGEDAVLVYGGDVPDPVAPSPLGDVILQQPWGAWPPITYAPHEIATDGGRAFAVAPRGATTFALARSLSASPPAVVIDRDVDPSGSAKADPTHTAGEVFALALTPDRTAIGARTHYAGGGYYGSVDIEEAFVSTPLGCASAPLAGHVFARDGVFFIGASRSPSGDCGDAPTALAIFPGFPDPDGVPIPLDLSVRRVRVAPRGAGAWVVSQSHVDEPVSFVRVDPVLADGTPDPQLGTLHPALTADTDFDAVSLGDKLAIAVIHDQGQRIHVVIVEPDGSRSTRDIDVAQVIDELALLASPDGRQLLVAWTDRVMGNLHVTRLGC